MTYFPYRGNSRPASRETRTVAGSLRREAAFDHAQITCGGPSDPRRTLPKRSRTRPKQNTGHGAGEGRGEGGEGAHPGGTPSRQLFANSPSPPARCSASGAVATRQPGTLGLGNLGPPGPGSGVFPQASTPSGPPSALQLPQRLPRRLSLPANSLGALPTGPGLAFFPPVRPQRPCSQRPLRQLPLSSPAPLAPQPVPMPLLCPPGQPSSGMIACGVGSGFVRASRGGKTKGRSFSRFSLPISARVFVAGQCDRPGGFGGGAPAHSVRLR